MTFPDGFSFSVGARDGNARCAEFVTPRATITTPVFMPVGTQATVKTQTVDEVAATGSRIILANTYHLWLRPGPDVIAHFGGVASFMNWPHALLTDSGGYQVFSLAKLRKIDDDGVTFRSHLDGSEKRMTPEESMRIQAALGADVAMVLDECPPGGAERSAVEAAIRRTTAWAQRSLAVPAPFGQARFGIVQGAAFEDLRRSHLDEIAALPCAGVALGGFSVGEPIEEMYRVLDTLVPLMRADRPRYLMGVGTPYDLLHAIGCGIDMFDCVLPTRNARNAQALTFHGRVNFKQARHKQDNGPISTDCGCTVCAHYTRGYLHHLI